jgi:ketopantoate reductase
MRVFVAGATGAIGQYLVPALVAAGQEVTGTTRSPSKASQLKNAGELVVSLMTEARGSSNAKAKAEFGWSPRYPSWRDGFPVWTKEAHDHAA